MHKSISFLRGLTANNHKEWFDANRNSFQEARSEFEAFIDRLIVEVRLFDHSVGSLTAKDCMFRIYRDVRFARDKTPYKNHFGAYIAQGGRKSFLGGYYFHLEPLGEGDQNRSFLAGGIFCPEANTLKAIRTDIYECIDEYKSIIYDKNFVDTFEWFEGSKLSKAPKGFPKDFPDIELIKPKDYTFSRNIDSDMLVSDRLLEESVRVFRLMLPFNNFMNRAIRNMSD